MKTPPIAAVLAIITLSMVGCDGRSDPVVVTPAAPAAPSVVVVPQQQAAPAPAPSVVVVPQAAPAPIIVEREHRDHDRVVVVQEAPVVYREVYVEGRPAPSIRVEVVPNRPRQDAVWVQGRWEREHDDHEGKRREQWGWHVGFWR